MQEVLGPLDAAHDHILVWRQPVGLELPREGVGAVVGDRGQLLQGRAGVEVPLDVLDDDAEPPRAGPGRVQARDGVKFRR